ncbi:FAD-binding oxidoreductase [Limisalsivibrio acetivorans]|uniref:FAD-binding oxidoreductase n=1 Tax=Limisalsivibrio acetivorans TaxID=1304888 RepID=UPI0003B6865D|nr:FAD-binding oxidoreductase [Limisalsivibrio acetivorans]
MKVCGWGKYPVIESNVKQLRNIETAQELYNSGTDFIPYGNGRSYGDSALADNILACNKYDYFLSFDNRDGTLHCQSGAMLSDILTAFVPKGWFLSVTPGTKLITVGGAIASDVHGKNHHIEGCFSSCVEEMELLLPDNRVVKCAKSDELFKATCGGMGLTGVILTAKLKLKKIPSSTIEQTTIKTKNLKETFEAFEAYSHLPYSVAWIDCLAKEPNIGKCLLMVGDFCKRGKLKYEPKGGLGIPFEFPSISLNKASVSLFNTLYYRKAPEGISEQKVDIDSFFYPLDSIGNWNRIYGRKGFTQYQFILPKERSYDGLKKILDTISKSGKGSFLAVLKLYGKANDNYLSFPIEGYSLALDFKIERGLFRLLDELDRIVLEHGGRIYLTKDVRVSSEAFAAGYHKLKDFRALRMDYKMDKHLNSLQSRRLGL